MKIELILATGVALLMTAVLADRTVVEKAPDGVNTITRTVDDRGYVTSEQMTCVHVQQKYEPPTDDENAECQQVLIDLLAAVKAQAREEAADAAVVQQVFGEGSNSSFIVRRELTATQKRFLALGHQYVRLAHAFIKLDARVKALESEAANRRSALAMEVK